MAKTRPCSTPGCSCLKMPGHPKWCRECWERRQSIADREAFRADRLNLAPEESRRRTVPRAWWPPGRRWCSGCQTFVSLEDVAESASRCRTCLSVDAHRGKVESEYGVPREVFDALMKEQDGRCALCRRKLHSRRPALDHDHRTGQLRGLLCPDPDWGCNHKVMPRADEDPDGPAVFAIRLYHYVTDPPAGRVQVRA